MLEGLEFGGLKEGRGLLRNSGILDRWAFRLQGLRVESLGCFAIYGLGGWQCEDSRRPKTPECRQREDLADAGVGERGG